MFRLKNAWNAFWYPDRNVIGLLYAYKRLCEDYQKQYDILLVGHTKVLQAHTLYIAQQSSRDALNGQVQDIIPGP